jgi:single-stranded-DNA-specific exonuclease
MLDAIWDGRAVLSVERSLSGRRWVWRAPAEDRLGFAISQRLGLPELVGRVMAARDIGIEDAADFLSPRLRTLLPDPHVLADMEAAAARLADAVQRAEHVAVFGDYDVDGACSAALLTLFLRGLGCVVTPYVPDRLREGYGPNAPALERLASDGASLVVCVDCGTSAHAALEALHGRADAIILDHHKADAPPPPVLAVVNPNRLDDTSRLVHLCAAGVAFMTAVATLRLLRRRGAFAASREPDLRGLLDLVALATVCDVMPLTGLNRAFVAQGLKIMAAGARPGLRALLEVASAREAPSAMTCGFALGPRINAGGRISEADLGLRLLLTDDPLEARALAERLDAANRQRQHVEAGVLVAAEAAAQAQAAAGRAVLVLGNADWHPGVVGIVAGRLKEKFFRPVCVGGGANGVIKGSGRSVAGFDLGAAVIAARQSGLLVTGGGHAMAAGYSHAPEREADFQAFLCGRLPDGDASVRPPVFVEAAVSATGATLEVARALGRLAPFGAGNEEPMVVVPDVRVVKADRLGADGRTVRAYVEPEGGGKRLKVLMFRAAETPVGEALLAGGGTRLHLAGHLRAETFNGASSVGFFISDAAPAAPG